MTGFKKRSPARVGARNRAGNVVASDAKTITHRRLQQIDFANVNAAALARILCGEASGDFDETQWRRVVDSAMIFADAWAAKALALGWVAEDVFALHPTAPAARHGLAWLLANGARVVAINSADIVTAAGSKQRFYRRGTASDG